MKRNREEMGDSLYCPYMSNKLCIHKHKFTEVNAHREHVKRCKLKCDPEVLSKNKQKEIYKRKAGMEKMRLSFLSTKRVIFVVYC